MGFQVLRGTHDLLGEAVARWSRIERAARRLARLYGYREIRTPLMEDAALFLRSVGETTDIVQKEMFRFQDRGGHEIVLRPEGTASVVRAYLEHNLHKTQGFAKLYYAGPMFRAERPQAGRLRQFHQYGVEAIGSASPWVDVEVVTLCVHILRACGVGTLAVWIASMGCRPDQARAAERLRRRLTPERERLCQDCQGRFDRNIFRVLDCKQRACQEIAWSGQDSPFPLCEACQVHFDEVRRGLREGQIPFDDTKVFARGLDYYTRTIFEVRAEGLGAQDAVAAGGRYDHLVEELGGPSVGAVGFAAGIERVLLAVPGDAGAAAQPRGQEVVYLAVAQPTLLGKGFSVVQELRNRGIGAVMDYEGKSLKAQLREADKAGCRLVAILGESELRQQAMTLKDLGQGTQDTVPFDRLADEVGRRVKPTCH